MWPPRSICRVSAVELCQSCSCLTCPLPLHRGHNRPPSPNLSIESPRILHEEEAKREQRRESVNAARLASALQPVSSESSAELAERHRLPHGIPRPKLRLITHLGVESDECDNRSSSVRCVTPTGRPSNSGHSEPDTGGVSLVLIPFGQNVHNVRTNPLAVARPDELCATSHAWLAAWSTLHPSRPSSTPVRFTR